MKTLLTLLLAFVVFTLSQAQEPLSVIKYEDVKIVSTKTGKALWRKEGYNSPDSVLAKFGDPDRIEQREEEAVGGATIVYFYGENSFHFLLGKDELIAFTIYNDEFKIILKDNIEIKIGGGVKTLEKVIDPDRHSENKSNYNNVDGLKYISYFTLRYEKAGSKAYYSSDVIGIIYNPKTKKIIKIHDYPLS